ncbi:MAG: tRNA lysidine(34) synthetase TilS [Hydrogenophilaceae bacterium]|nr:tRNA lysidine(34) synthetase TilS [Hydrogenophilaceae bacterium]
MCVGLSGGLDSVVLLHSLKALRGDLNFVLSAVHVDHGLSPNAGAWAGFCERLCADWQVPLTVARVQVKQAGKQGLEAAARTARYAAFAEQVGDDIVLAQHRDDQAETVLHQLLRGAGVKGLAAMPAERNLAAGPMRLLRPLLDLDRTDLQAYAEAHGLAYVEDESNLDPGYTRNFLRHHVLTEIERRFPAYRSTLARAARHFADCDQLLDDLARADAEHAIADGCLMVSGLAALSPARARNLLRFYLIGQGWPAPPADWLAEALDQLIHARPDAELRLRLAGRSLARYRDRIHVLDVLPEAEMTERLWQGEAVLTLPGYGQLEFARAQGQGISAARLDQAPVSVGPYEGGGEIRPDCRRPRRTAKKLMQEAAVPPWERRQLPALYCGAQLVWLAGVGVDCDFQAGPDEPGWLISWRR